LITDYTE
jgi:hypothetical protein